MNLQKYFNINLDIAVMPVNDGMCSHSNSFCILKKDMNHCMKNNCKHYLNEN